MIRPKKLILVLAGIFFIAGCKKELSEENGGNPITGGGNPALGNDCKIEKMASIDTASGLGLASLLTQFGSNDFATRVEVFDSLSYSLKFAANLTYSGDTIRIDDNDFFLVDPSYRVTQFNTLNDPSNPAAGTLIFKYYYDLGGYLNKKEIYQDTIPVPVTVNYTWTNGNLVAIDGSVAGQVKVLDGEIEYYPSKSAKNFMYVFPDAYELAPYILAVNLGNKSNNLVNKITLRVYSNGAVANTYTNTISNLKFSADGYLTEMYSSGDAIGGLLLFNGLTKFSYKCK